ncbi:MAG: xylulokinase [Pontixanthobacter sp.]
MSKGALAGIDLGAGSLKVSIIDERGKLLGSGSAPVETLALRPGWSEQEPDDWWTALCIAVPIAIRNSGIPADTIKAVSFSAGAHTCVLVDADDKVVRPAILWNDQRSLAECEILRSQTEFTIEATAGNAITPTWTLPQLYWLKRHQPEALSNVRRLYPAKDYLRSRLTGDWSTDPIDAAGTLMFDQTAGGWSAPICEQIGWPVESLPPIGPSEAVAGHITREAAQASGLPIGIPVVRGSSDTAVEALGSGMLGPETGTIKLATAATLSCFSHAPAEDNALITYPYLLPGSWYLITGTNSCASAHAWLRKTLFSCGGKEMASFAEMDHLASEVLPGAEGLFFHPYLNGERTPYWDPKLRADFVGFGFNHGPGHVVRAFYEGVAYALCDCLKVFKTKQISFSSARITGGGSQSAVWRQIVADALEIPIELPVAADASYGAALLAGIGTGMFSDFESLDGVIEIAARNDPNPANFKTYRQGVETYRHIQRELSPIYRAIHDARHEQNVIGG